MFDKPQQSKNSEAGPQVGRGIPRYIEAVLAFIGLLVSAPFLAVAAIAVAASSRGPVIFSQHRIGRHGQGFILYKLRTMYVANSGPQVTARDDCRITRVGRFLRKSKLDELPELWNVIRGDMSLVGPRPEVPRYVDLQNPLWQRVLEARPGITDPMTLILRNEEDLLQGVGNDRERFYLETLQKLKLKGYVKYLQERTWKRDINVLWQTILVVTFPRKASPPMPKANSTYIINDTDRELS